MTLELNPLRKKFSSQTGVFNIAHRGARAFAPENTLAAFEKAKTFGCRMFEIDVHMSKDGRLIVHHDDHLTRCTDVRTKFPGRRSYFVSDFTCDELRLLDAGSWYISQIALPVSERQWFLQTLTDAELEDHVSPDERRLYASGEIRLPTLEETLELAAQAEMMVNIELKTLPRMYPGLADAVVDLVESMAMAHRVLISSFDHEQLERVRRRTSIIATGVLTGDRLANPGWYLQLLDADAYHPGMDSLGFSSVARKLESSGITHVRAKGLGVNVWTCNDRDEMWQLIAAGVTGLISDYPNRVREVLLDPGL